MESFSKDVAHDLKALEKKVKECSLITAKLTQDYLGDADDSRRVFEYLLCWKKKYESIIKNFF